jgi:hypothetical protein
MSLKQQNVTRPGHDGCKTSKLRDRILRKLIERGQTADLSPEDIERGLREQERSKAELAASIARTEEWARKPLERSPDSPHNYFPISAFGLIGGALMWVVIIAIKIFVVLGVIGILVFGIRQLF